METCACLSRRELVLGSVAAAIMAGSLLPRGAGAQTPPAPVAQELARGRTDYSEIVGGPAELITLRVTVPPGGIIAWHTHPGPVQGVVTAGELTVYQSDGCTSTYRQGSAVFVTPGTLHEEHNDGSVPLELIASYLVPEGSPIRVAAEPPEPATCPAD